MNGGGRPQADRPTSLTVGTPLPGCPDRTAKRRTMFDFPCHCEAVGRGDRRECLWCNLLVSCADLYNVPGDSHGASPLGMTGGEIVRIRRGAVVHFVHTAERHGGRSLRGDSQNTQGRPQADRPTSLTVGTPLPGCPDRTAKRRTGFDFPCHCEAEGRGDRRECLWCNLLVLRTISGILPGDCHVGLRPPRNDSGRGRLVLLFVIHSRAAPFSQWCNHFCANRRKKD